MPQSNDSAPEPAAVTWTPPQSEQIPALQISMGRWLSHPTFLMTTCGALEAGQGTIVPAADTPLESTVILHAEEANRLSSAQPFTLDAETTEDALAAGAALPDWSVEPDDLPAPEGLMVFDRPIGYCQGRARVPLPVVACSWGPSPQTAPPGGAVWVTFWSAGDRESLIAESIAHGTPPAEARYNVETGTPPLLWADEALVCWSASGTPIFTPTSRCVPTDEVTGIVVHQEAAPWLQTVFAAWNFIRNQVVEITEARAPRAERRRAERTGKPLPSVRVVSARRRTSSAPPSAPTGRSVSVRFPVRGFWRDQPFGQGRSLRKRIWIKRHWRGPEDAPVRIRPVVIVVEKPTDLTE
ncbi:MULTISPECIES: hypothetical protein [Amycolatopsis]|uniref:Uncharacterized protein n=1 Tax=Amycolatopsis saalfeldensis TaxID=394193 RepID=A0A1H8YQZ7_9PSEU|nr:MULTISPECIES: hypothetical protein [Amycolatopsis]SEP54587.1 hypothetical protein SAMN04489732_1612 [Amycolatopsis saalfeldensis]